MRIAATYLDRKARNWLEGVVVADHDGVRLLADAPTPGMPRLDGVITGGFTDAHVHLQLVDATALADSVLGTVVDLGGNPAFLASVHNSSVLTRTRPPRVDSGAVSEISAELCAPGGVHIAFAGAFLTPPGGYPSDRDWAPAGSWREIPDAAAAERAIAEMKSAGATCIKVASNSNAGPTFTDEMFATIVEIAGAHNLSVVAHAEGPGEAQRAARLHAHMLAHAPFSERLTDEEIYAMNGTVAWISTLAIHGGAAYDVAIDNVRRFHAIGGNIRYGTDMGNGPTPVGLNPREIQALRDAGITGTDLLRSLAPADPLITASRLLFFPGQSAESADPLSARTLTPADLET